MMNMTAPASVEFGQPVVGPKVYVTKGPSGWIETFKRGPSDAALKAFMAPVEIAVLVDMFVVGRDLANAETNWHTIVGFIARMLNITPRAVPAEVGVAFWGHIVLAAQSAN